MKSIFRSRPAKAVLKGKIFFAYSPREKSNNVKKIEKILVEHGAELSFFLNKRVKCIYGYGILTITIRESVSMLANQYQAIIVLL